mmetsp:Transcript_16084/g.41632  ORF Transcript_16084/g.41632 Transcript_16084/m.41632 type:complete len:228 (-) Transcript_16084:135-818(-)
MVSTSCSLRVASIARYAATACGTEWLYPRRKRRSLISPETSSSCGNSSRSDASSIRMRVRSGASSVVVSGSTSSVSSWCMAAVDSAVLGKPSRSLPLREERRRGVMTRRISCSACAPCRAPSVICRASTPPVLSIVLPPREKECVERFNPDVSGRGLSGAQLAGGTTASATFWPPRPFADTPPTPPSLGASLPATCGKSTKPVHADLLTTSSWRLERCRSLSMRTTR